MAFAAVGATLLSGRQRNLAAWASLARALAAHVIEPPTRTRAATTARDRAARLVEARGTGVALDVTPEGAHGLYAASKSA